jgi:NitT/TauT family transport system permease protein
MTQIRVVARRMRFFRGIAHAAFLTLFLGTWEWAVQQGFLNRTFYGQPSSIALFLWENFIITGKLWAELGWSLAATFAAFALASAAAVSLGLLFVMFPSLEEFTEPYLSAVNAMPRIALAPLFLLWFGLGIGSKIALGFSLAFFIVLSSTVAGIRGVNSDHVTLTRTLGAKGSQMFFFITLPSAVPVIFSGLRLGLIYALLGVIGGEIIAAENGLGQVLAYLAATFNMNGVMGLLLVLALLGLGVTWAMTKVERYLLRWQ